MLARPCICGPLLTCRSSVRCIDFGTKQKARLQGPWSKCATASLPIMDMEQVSPDKVQQEYRDTGEAKGESALRHRPWYQWLSGLKACGGQSCASNISIAVSAAALKMVRDRKSCRLYLGMHVS